jgi:hypothetical protein
MFRTFVGACITILIVAFPAFTEDKGTPTELDGLKSQVPASWKQKDGAGMRVMQFTIPKEKGDEHDGEFIVFFFGKGGGGGVDANITRWKGMITPPAGKKIDDIAKIDKAKIGEIPVTILDMQGEYTHKTRPFDPNDAGEKRENYRMIGIIIESPNGPFFVRVTGPAKTIEANKKAIDSWIKNMK